MSIRHVIILSGEWARVSGGEGPPWTSDCTLPIYDQVWPAQPDIVAPLYDRRRECISAIRSMMLSNPWDATQWGNQLIETDAPTVLGMPHSAMNQSP